MALKKKADVRKVDGKKSGAVKKAARKATSKKTVELETSHVGIDWRSIYLYAVCLITLLVVLFSTVALLNAMINALFPDPAYIDPYSQPENAPSTELLAQQEKNNRVQAIKNIFSTFATIAIAAPLYIYHWRQTKK